MAMECVHNPKSNKRKRRFMKKMEGVHNPKSNKLKRRFTKKLRVNEEVEVRSVEEGLLGSWHPGTVTECVKLKRHVRYKNLLKDDGLDCFVHVVRVSNALDGHRHSGSIDCNKRGFIRPLPPSVEFDSWYLKFGLCVDVNYQEAWWEGVIFDHCDGMEKRTIFFPDLGDEMQVGIHQLRITQDWDEVTEEWKRRGKWVFLELVEECQRGSSFVAVSARQIWYDVQEKEEFVKIGEWTYNVKDLCRNMVMEVVNDYLTLTEKELFSVLNLPGSLLNERPEQESVKPMANVDLNMMALPDKEITPEGSEKPCKNDYICSVCNYGGELILCDKCPSSFHKTCLGLEDIPDGDWFCPSCRCRICGQRKVDGVEDGHVLTCVQCEHKYHVGCLKNGAVGISRFPENWFCGEDCEKIHKGLHELLGKPVSVGVENLTWTLLKFIKPDSCDLGRIKSDSKFNLALSVMHECFEPLKESFYNRDVVEDVIFSRRSELNRLNFQGFYTVLLERNEKLISVATVRVHGKKVAEVPLVGTRSQYRRRGMCHILMIELEKMLMQLGVERLVLPAVPSLLETWTGSFGFAKMTNFERSQFLDYTFLDFQDTIMCQKLLMMIPPPDSEIDKGGMLDQQMGDTCAGNNDHHVVGAIGPATMVEQEQPIPRDHFLEKQADRYNGPYKCYTRRKVRKEHEGFGMPL